MHELNPPVASFPARRRPFALRRGVFWACLLFGAALAQTSSATAPAGRFVLGTTDGVDTIADTKTGLVWQKAWGGAAAFTSAQAACIALGAAWRVPSVSELLTIFEDGTSLELTFPAAQGTDPLLWTSSPEVRTPGRMWTVSLEHGQTQGDFAATAHRAPCVR
ncbi:MAG TPA: DUF1566 domain-containing protein [Polyangiaceae bacterium]|nr:DUF1566 domain-containing protein [Polyangiaceae bacterium]